MCTYQQSVKLLRQSLAKLKGKINISKIIVEDFNTLLSIMNKQPESGFTGK